MRVRECVCPGVCLSAFLCEGIMHIIAQCTCDSQPG